ncbi:MAG: plastocyanin/azurin family copper-binding protein [Nitrosarchaeum sp.]
MYYPITIVVIVILGSFSFVHAEDYVIEIPFGAYNPELNTPAEVWFDPPVLSINIGDTITWINNDKEGHTVTSGQSSGRFGWMNNDFGTSDGIFDSDRFMPNESWSYTFEKSDSYSYYCTIHPWMEGIVVVKQSPLDYPHDSFGNKIESFPVIKFTPDNIIEADLTWEPYVIKTHEGIKFIYQFYNRATNTNLANMKYDFVLIQNGKEIYRDTGLTQIGGDYRNFVFEKPGSIIIRFEGIEGTAGTPSDKSIDVTSIKAVRTVEFSTIVYDNTEKMTHEQMQVKPAQRSELYYQLFIVIILAPAVVFVMAIFWMKKKPKNSDQKYGSVKI